MRSLLLIALALAAPAYAGTSVWTCTSTASLGSGAWGAPAATVSAEVCQGFSPCDTSLTSKGYVGGVCELLSAAGSGDFVKATTDGSTVTWVPVSTVLAPPVVVPPVVVPPVVVPPVVVTQARTFTWVGPLAMSDGTPLTGTVTYNVYLDGALLNTAPVTAPSYAATITVGGHSVTTSAVIAGVESDQCAPVAFAVTGSSKPGTVTGLTVK